MDGECVGLGFDDEGSVGWEAALGQAFDVCWAFAVDLDGARTVECLDDHA